MFCLFTENHSCLSTTVIIIFYTCVWIPFRELKHYLGSIIDAIFSRGKAPVLKESPCFVDLTVARYADLDNTSRCADDNEEEEVCCVCLTEFEKDDAVNQLPKCRHVFHIGCIEGWLNRNRFSCPLCRSLLLSVAN